MTDNATAPTPLPGDDREGWMMFRYGGPLQLLELTPQQVDIRDIVHGLAQINRFNGQSAEAIPVLWHSLMVMRLCTVEDHATRLEALFHDAAETYVGDWIRPLRGVIGDRLTQLRDRIQETVFEAVGLPQASTGLSAPVHAADYTMLRCEMEAESGYGRVVSWYPPPTDAERRQVREAMKDIGRPPQTRFGLDRLAGLFLAHAERLVGPDAPIRDSLEKAARERRRA